MEGRAKGTSLSEEVERKERKKQPGIFRSLAYSFALLCCPVGVP